MSALILTLRIRSAGGDGALIALLGLAGLFVLLPGVDLAAADEPLKTTDIVQGPFGIGSCHACNSGADANKSWIPQMPARSRGEHGGQMRFAGAGVAHEDRRGDRDARQVWTAVEREDRCRRLASGLQKDPHRLDIGRSGGVRSPGIP